MSRIRPLLIIPLMLAAAACTLTSGPATITPAATTTPLAVGQPSITIESPDDGVEVNVGDNILVSATATDDVGVTSVQLFADERLVKTVSAEDAQGDTRLPVVMDYVPRNAGQVTLEVIAYRDAVPSEPATVSLTVLEEGDSGSDGGTNGGSDGGNSGNGGNDGGGVVIDPFDPTCRILTNVALNYRVGPGTNFDRLGTFSAGTQAPIVGRLPDNSWWQVRVNNFTRAWVSANFTTEYGNCINIPIVAPPPTATAPVPTNTPTPPPTNTPIPSETPVPTATNTPRPADLVVSDITGAEELTLEAGGSVSATFTVQITNTGDSGTSAPFENAILILPDDRTIDLGVVSGLAAGESILLRQSIEFDTVGEFTVQAQADSGDNLDEISDVNNIASLVINVIAGE